MLTYSATGKCNKFPVVEGKGVEQSDKSQRGTETRFPAFKAGGARMAQWLRKHSPCY